MKEIFSSSKGIIFYEQDGYILGSIAQDKAVEFLSNLVKEFFYKENYLTLAMLEFLLDKAISKYKQLEE